ncbi:MAG: hypothetical protein J2O39_09045, partial [Acidimicrobiales bacterium]|nr:hypothetical protein [Acidimicrobiales bacterium]
MSAPGDPRPGAGSDGALRPEDRSPTAGTLDPPRLRWGLGDVVGGFLAGFLLGTLGASAWVAAAHVPVVHGQPREVLGSLLVSLAGLWIGLGGAVVLASRWKGTGRLAVDFGLRLRPWPDIPLGLVAGVGGQFLVTAVYLPAGH